MMPEMDGSEFAVEIFWAMSAELLAKKSSTSAPISEPYSFFRLTYLVITGLSLSRIMSNLGLVGRDEI